MPGCSCWCLCGSRGRLRGRGPPSSSEGGYGGSLLVENVHCNKSHGVSIGSVRHGVVRNVTVRNVTLANGENGIRVKAYPAGSGEISGILYEDVTIRNVRNPLLIDGFYCPPTQRPYPCHPGKTAVHIHDVVIRRVRGDAHRGSAGYIDCDPSAPCTGIVLEDVRFEAAEGQPSPVQFNCNATSRKARCSAGCGNAHGTQRRVEPDACLAA